MTSSTIRLPESQPADATDVTLALEVASAVWEKGDGRDAIKWLMRAVEAAEDAGHSGRAETFMRAIAEIGRAMETTGQSGTGAPGETSAAPAASATPPSVAAAPAAAPALQVGRTPPPPPPAPAASTAPRTRTQPPPLPSAASRAPTPPPPPADAAAPSPPSLRPPPTPSKAPPPPTASKAPPTPSKAPPPPAAPLRAPTPPPAPVAQRHDAPAGPEGPAASPRTSESRIRVYVRRSTLDPSLYVVRPLADGSALPAGAREGSLALLGADFEDIDRTAAQ